MAARARTIAGATVAGAVIALAAPAVVAAHQLNPTYTSRLPLAVYLAGAAATVALSFVFVLVRDVRATRPDTDDPGRFPPRALRLGLRAIGLIGWLWIVAQGIAGGESSGDVISLFLWVYGWVALAGISALLGPVWQYLDPFSTLFDLGAAIVRRVGLEPWPVAELPAALQRWPAVVGFAIVVWLELVFDAGPRVLFVVVVGYTALTLAMMAQFGRDTWRSNAEIFTIWFRLLGRLAPFALVDEDGRIRRRGFASGLLEPGWSIADVVLIALAVGSILFDGLSQTQIWYDLFGVPLLLSETLVLIGFLGAIVIASLAVTRFVGIAATGAGLLPIAVGYLIAHYLTYVLINGQSIVVALSDPFQRGWDLFGTAFYEPTGAWLPPGLVWTVQLAAVVGGHMLGAWGGHVVAALEAPRSLLGRTLTLRQVPLAVVMVALTTLTLWSLGQAIVVTPTQPSAATGVVAVRDSGMAAAQAIATSGG
ncbi:MAG TPA: hypothetical protein VFJ80_03760 [Candidatus Limnocylindrales bacterium]|nr:hypothetical protein [Candidatus Limnocylindrales bacterium]